jgi:hypothetical protein
MADDIVLRRSSWLLFVQQSQSEVVGVRWVVKRQEGIRIEGLLYDGQT